jgi:hypothetical protein
MGQLLPGDNHMRARTTLLLLAVLLVAGFAALNWPEFARNTTLNFGLLRMDAPLGAIMLGLLGLVLLISLASSASLRSRMMLTENRYTRDLQVQRDLADKAEASRFTELRQYLDTHFREGRQRDPLLSAEFEKSMMQSQRDLRTQLEQMMRGIDARLSSLESRFESRMEPRSDLRMEPRMEPRPEVRMDPRGDVRMEPRGERLEPTMEVPPQRPLDKPQPPRNPVKL